MSDNYKHLSLNELRKLRRDLDREIDVRQRQRPPQQRPPRAIGVAVLLSTGRVIKA